jgi:hypothetical protein
MRFVRALPVVAMSVMILADGARPQTQAAAPSIEYVNPQYDFCFSLPATWKGYSILNSEWEGGAPGGQSSEKGPLIRIRSPKWTEDDPHEDIPIMVFTPAQWRLVKKDELTVSAAPVGPMELGHNSRYVFALPSRYNFDSKTGREEVAEIMKNKSLHAPCAAHPR